MTQKNPQTIKSHPTVYKYVHFIVSLYKSLVLRLLAPSLLAIVTLANGGMP